MRDADVLVVGGGICGLATAFGLQKRGYSVEVFEATQHAGGVIGSRRRDGFLFETGPNSTLDNNPLIDELLTDLGITGERGYAPPIASIRYIVRGGRLLPLPNSPGTFLSTSAFSFGAKLRLLREPFIPAGPAGDEESIAQFVRRRLGAEFLDYAADPFVAGIYAGNPEEISVAAAFPRLFALEQNYGSLSKGMIRSARVNRASTSQSTGEKTKPMAATFTFRNGMQTLPDALARALPRIEYGVSIERVARNGDGSMSIEGMCAGSPIARRARAAVIAAPAHIAASLIGEQAPEASRALAAIPYAPIAGVASAYRRADVTHSLAGFGFLVPKKEQRRILGTLFSSSMFEGRAPQDNVLLTTFAGGRRNPEIAALSDDAVAQIVGEELASLVGAAPTPLWQQVTRWPQAIPQYTIGHLDRMRQIDAAEAALAGLYFCGNYRGGVSVGDCIKSAHATAETVDRFLRGV